MNWTQLITGLLIVVLPFYTFAQETAPEIDTVEEEQHTSQIRDQTIQNLIRRIDRLEEELQSLRNGAAKDDSVPTAPEGTSDATETDTLVQAAFERALINRGGLLLPPKSMEYEVNLNFVTSSNDRIYIDGITVADVVVVGDIVNERVRRDRTTLALTARVGLPKDTQLEVRLPYSYEKRMVVTADNEEEKSTASEMGDVQLLLSHHFLRATSYGPDILGSLRYKSTTGGDPYQSGPGEQVFGTGFESYTLSATFVKATDPVVFFGGYSYTTNIASHKPVGKVSPGDSHSLSLGLAIALNLDTSINFGVEQGYTQHTLLDGREVPGSSLRTGIFSVGVSYYLSNDLSIYVGVGVGLTDDSPDSLISVTLPIRVTF